MEARAKSIMDQAGAIADQNCFAEDLVHFKAQAFAGMHWNFLLLLFFTSFLHSFGYALVL
jgi:hypothetical protein